MRWSVKRGGKKKTKVVLEDEEDEEEEEELEGGFEDGEVEPELEHMEGRGEEGDEEAVDERNGSDERALKKMRLIEDGMPGRCLNGTLVYFNLSGKKGQIV